MPSALPGSGERSVESLREHRQALDQGCRVQAAVPSRESQAVARQHERGGEVKRIEAAKIVLEGECGGVLDQ